MSVSEAAILNETALRELRNGNVAAAQQLLERAVAVEPRHLFALLQKATLLESQGKQRAAAKVHHNALQTIQPGASIPAALHGLIDKAVAATKRTGKRRIFAPQPTFQFPAAASARVFCRARSSRG